MSHKARDYPELFELHRKGTQWHWINKPLGIDQHFIFGDEATLFRLAGQLERARPWANRIPPGCEAV
jgi:hypothetical protein